MKCMVLFTLTVLIAGTWAQFNPTLTVDSCTQSSLVLTTVGAEDNGIIYVQGQGAACKQTTSSGTQQHTIDFNSCGIQWEESFNIVIQKKAAYQTGADKQIPIMCIADLADIDVTNNLNAADKDDDAGQNKTVKPTATMVLFKDGNVISGGTVKLTDTVTMSLKLDDEYMQDFDIKARDCTASTINIVTSHCSADIDLFPHITKVQQGELSATFGAFRTTDLAGGSVSMTFSCTLQVCLGACPTTNLFLDQPVHTHSIIKVHAVLLYNLSMLRSLLLPGINQYDNLVYPASLSWSFPTTTCADGATSYGRKKREIVRRQAADSGIEDISVGSSIAITTEEIVIESPEESDSLCMNQWLFVALVIILVGGFVACSVLTVIMFRKLQEKSNILKKLNPNHLSTMPVA